MSHSQPGTTPTVAHTVVAQTSRKESSSKTYRAKKSMKPSIGNEELARLTYVELLEEPSPRSDEIQHKLVLNKQTQRKGPEKVDDGDKGVKRKPPLPPQHKQKPDTEHGLKVYNTDNVLLKPSHSGAASTHLETTTLSAVMTEHQSSLPSIIIPDSDVSATHTEGIRHSTPIERLAMKEGIISLKRLTGSDMDTADGASHSASGKSLSKKEKPRRERRQSGVISTRVPHRSGSSGNTSLHNTSKHGRVKSAPNTSVEKLKKRMSKKDSTKLLKQRKSSESNPPGHTEIKETPLKLGKSRQKSEKGVKVKHGTEEQPRKEQLLLQGPSYVSSSERTTSTAAEVVAGESSEINTRKKSKQSSSSSKTSKSRNDTKSTKKKHKSSKKESSSSSNIIMSSGIVSYPSHTSCSSNNNNNITTNNLLAQTSAFSGSTVTEATKSLHRVSSASTTTNNITTLSAGGSLMSSSSAEMPTSAQLDILPLPGHHHHKKRPSSSLSEAPPLSIARSKKLSDLEQPPAPLHNKSKLDKMISVVACLSAQKSPSSRRRTRRTLSESEEGGRGGGGSGKKRLWMTGAAGTAATGRGSSEDIFGESLGSCSVGTSMYDSSSRMSIGGFYNTGPRKRSNSDSLSECSRLDTGPRNYQKRKRRKSNTVLELSTLGANYNMDITRPTSAMGIRKDDVSELFTSAGILKLPVGPEKDQFTEDVLELCKNIKDSSWIQTSGGKTLDSSVVLSFNPLHGDQITQNREAGDKSYIPPDIPDVNEDAPNVLDIISRINQIAKDTNNNNSINNPLELCVPKAYFNPAGLNKSDKTKNPAAEVCPDKEQSTNETVAAPNKPSTSVALVEQDKVKGHLEDTGRSSSPTQSSTSATFIVNSSSPDHLTIEDSKALKVSPAVNPVHHHTSRHATHITYEDSINIQLNSPKEDIQEECSENNGGVGGRSMQSSLHVIGPTVSEDERTVEAIISKYIPDKDLTGATRRVEFIVGEDSKDSGGSRRGGEVILRDAAAGDVLASAPQDLAVYKQQWSKEGGERQFRTRDVRSYDPSTQAALLSNKEEKVPNIMPHQPLDLRVVNQQKERPDPALTSVGSSPLEDASLCMQQANNIQKTAFTHLVQYLTQQQALLEKLQKELKSQRKQRIAAENILRNLTAPDNVKDS